MSRRAARVDENQAAIVAFLRGKGWNVAVTSSLGHGFVDLVVGRGAFARLLEVKDGAKPPSARVLTPAEAKFREVWRDVYLIVTSPLDAHQQLSAAYEAST